MTTTSSSRTRPQRFPSNWPLHSTEPLVLVLALGGRALPGRESAYEAFLRLRHAVYVEETGYLTEHDPDQVVETDEDDARSLVFGVVEVRPGGNAVIAGLRLIVRGYAEAGAERPLPVELEWPEVFASSPLPSGAIEISRLIARHEDPARQLEAVQALFAALSAHFASVDRVPVYGLIDIYLERLIGRYLPMRRIGEPLWVEKYNSTNVAVQIDVERALAEYAAA